MQKCPTCNKILSDVNLARSDLVLKGCNDCSGHWITNDDALKLVLKCETHFDQILEDIQAEEVRINSEQVEYRACPACNSKMNRQLSKTNRFIIDYCLDHGVWLDRNELYSLVKEIGSVEPDLERNRPVEVDPVVNIWRAVRKGRVYCAMIVGIMGVT